LTEHGGTEHREERNEEELAEARRKVSGVFDALGIPYEMVLHPPVYSAFDNVRQDIKIDALICKNLFLRNKDKSRYYLFTLPIDKRADLASLQNALGETRLSFGNAEALWDMLHIHPGSVSLLNIIGAREGVMQGKDRQPVKPLKFLVDAEVLKEKRIGVHPNDNAATIVFPPERLPDLFSRYGADFDFISAV